VAHGYQEAQNRLVDAEWVRKQYEVAWKGTLRFAPRNPGVEVFQDSNILLGKIALAAHVDWGRLTLMSFRTCGRVERWRGSGFV